MATGSEWYASEVAGGPGRNGYVSFSTDSVYPLLSHEAGELLEQWSSSPGD